MTVETAGVYYDVEADVVTLVIDGVRHDLTVGGARRYALAIMSIVESRTALRKRWAR